MTPSDTRYDLCRCGRSKRNVALLCRLCHETSRQYIHTDKNGEQRLATFKATNMHRHWLRKFTWAEIHDLVHGMRHEHTDPLEDAA